MNSQWLSHFKDRNWDILVCVTILPVFIVFTTLGVALAYMIYPIWWYFSGRSSLNDFVSLGDRVFKGGD